ncbi:MAG: transcription termination/antitermination protein NusA [Gammaproteobacteria bacterium]|nr:transcription termination/antitermination protein NusA [Gammaproteobacteria bacterium]MBQ0840010.1 transcription termination/antitermination protein NusA [Gammaproteobacteria bacterium]
MNKEIFLVAEAVSNEKGVSKEVIFEAMEEALAMATKKRYDEESHVRVVIDRDSGDYETFRWWHVVDDETLAELGTQFTLEEAHEKDTKLVAGDTFEEKVENVKFGRIAAQAAKQVIVQKVRDAERELVAARYEGRVGELVSGTVKKVTREHIIVDLGNNAEGLLSREELVGREVFRINDRVRAILFAIRSEGRGPQLLLSRSCTEMLVKLFQIEVPEISEQVIEIRAASRDTNGARAKIAVKTNDGRMDPIGACVGMRGARVQAVSNELGGERVDIVLWDDNPAQLVINAMAPAEVESIIVYEETNTMDVAVAAENLAQAIGRGGQNVRLASELTGWDINVMTTEDIEAKQYDEAGGIIESFMAKLDVEEDVATILVEEGFTSVEEVAYVPLEELLSIDGFDEEIAEELRARAKDALLTSALVHEEELATAAPAEDLLAMEGMDQTLACTLAANGIITMEDLAEQAVDELLDLGVDAERAAELIMTARAPWFEEDAG